MQVTQNLFGGATAGRLGDERATGVRAQPHDVYARARTRTIRDLLKDTHSCIGEVIKSTTITILLQKQIPKHISNPIEDVLF